MKYLLAIAIVFILISCNSNSNHKKEKEDQVIENVPIPMEDNYSKVYNTYLKDSISVYTFVITDLDFDSQLDSIQFMGNGGAHTYFYLRVKLSTKKVWNYYQSLSIDLPYLEKRENLNDLVGSEVGGCAIIDIDNDGLDEIYIQLDSETRMPDASQKNGLHSRKLWLDYENGLLLVKDYNDLIR